MWGIRCLLYNCPSLPGSFLGSCGVFLGGGCPMDQTVVFPAIVGPLLPPSPLCDPQVGSSSAYALWSAVGP